MSSPVVDILESLAYAYGEQAVKAAIEAFQRRRIGKIADEAIDNVDDAFEAEMRRRQGDGHE